MDVQKIKEYIISKANEMLKKIFKRVGKERIIKYTIFGSFILILVYYAGIGVRQNYQKEKAYKVAVDLIEQGEYSAAVDYLENMDGDNRWNPDALIYLCWAHLAYDKENYEDAYEEVVNLKKAHYYRMTSKQMQQLQIDSFYQKVEDAYNNWYENGGKEIIEEREKEQEKERKKKAQEEERKRKREEKEKEKAESSGSYNNYYPRTTYRSRKYSDPYDVYDYDDPEDFYYDNEDDFDDYEDAEDYWEDAWGW